MSKKINKEQLGKDLQAILESEGIKTTAKIGEKLIEKLFEKFNDRLVEGETISVYGFGELEPKTRAGRKGRNPQTGEELFIQPKKHVAFKMQKKLKDSLNK